MRGPPRVAERQSPQPRTAAGPGVPSGPLRPAGWGRRTTHGPQQSQRPPPGCLGTERQVGLARDPLPSLRGLGSLVTVSPGSRTSPRTGAPEGHLPTPESPAAPTPASTPVHTRVSVSNLPLPRPHSPAEVSPEPVLPREGLPSPTPDTAPTTLSDGRWGPASLEALRAAMCDSLCGPSAGTRPTAGTRGRALAPQPTPVAGERRARSRESLTPSGRPLVLEVTLGQQRAAEAPRWG